MQWKINPPEFAKYVVSVRYTNRHPLIFVSIVTSVRIEHVLLRSQVSDDGVVTINLFAPSMWVDAAKGHRLEDGVEIHLVTGKARSVVFEEASDHLYQALLQVGVVGTEGEADATPLEDPQMRRPLMWDETVAYAAAEAARDKLAKFLKDTDPKRLDEAVGHLATAIRREHDAFVVVKALERMTWVGSIGLVELVEWTINNRYRVLNEIEAQWVERERPLQLWKVGDLVSVTQGTKRVNGEVLSVDTHLARYVVFCSELGHVRSGPGTTGTYATFEQVHPRPTETPA